MVLKGEEAMAGIVRDHTVREKGRVVPLSSWSPVPPPPTETLPEKTPGTATALTLKVHHTDTLEPPGTVTPGAVGQESKDSAYHPAALPAYRGLFSVCMYVR